MEWLSNNPEVVITLLTLIGTGFGWCMKALQGIGKSNKLQQEALKIILRRELKTLCDCCVRKEHANDSEMKEFLDTYEVYENLYGSNGYADSLKDEMTELYERRKV